MGDFSKQEYQYLRSIEILENISDESKKEIIVLKDEKNLLKEENKLLMDKLKKVEPLCNTYINDNAELKRKAEISNREYEKNLRLTTSEIDRLKAIIANQEKEDDLTSKKHKLEIINQRSSTADIVNETRLKLSIAETEIRRLNSRNNSLLNDNNVIPSLEEGIESFESQVLELELKIDGLESEISELSVNLEIAENMVENLRNTTTKNALIINTINAENNLLKQNPKPKTVEQAVLDILNKDGKIHEHILKYFLNLPELEREFTIGKTTVRRIFSGNGYFKAI